MHSAANQKQDRRQPTEWETIFANDANYRISDSYFENSIYTYFDGEITELNNNIFVDEKNNTFNDTPYYLYYEGEGLQLDIDPYIIGVFIGNGGLSDKYLSISTGEMDIINYICNANNV